MCTFNLRNKSKIFPQIDGEGKISVVDETVYGIRRPLVDVRRSITSKNMPYYRPGDRLIRHFATWHDGAPINGHSHWALLVHELYDMEIHYTDTEYLNIDSKYFKTIIVVIKTILYSNSANHSQWLI